MFKRDFLIICECRRFNVSFPGMTAFEYLPDNCEVYAGIESEPGGEIVLLPDAKGIKICAVLPE